jgi:hypothetical protein
VQRFLEFLDFGEMSVEEGRVRVFAGKVGGEFGDVENLNIISCFFDLVATVAAPAVVVGSCIVNFVLLLLRGWELKEVLSQGKLTVYICLGDSKVLDVKLPGRIRTAVLGSGESGEVTKSRTRT